MNLTYIRRFLVFVAFLMITAGVCAAQQSATAKVQVTVSPEEAYIFIDGHPYNHRSQSLNLVPGEYTIGIYNYGFVPQVEKVTLVAGSNPAIHASLTPIPARVSGRGDEFRLRVTLTTQRLYFLTAQRRTISSATSMK
jgi:hypothetical protein